jgi:DNA polymerase I-like protein with 3'-5' exonuclease and polymerase domains
MIYGAGAKGIHKDSGIPLVRVKEIISGFYRRYPMVNEYYTTLTSDVVHSGHCLEEIYRGPSGPEHYFEWTSPTGRTYKFHQDPYRPGPKYTELRNYPVQGTATGDIVPVLLGHIVNVLRNEGCNGEDFCMVNTTHDSVTIDCMDGVTAAKIKKLLDAEVFDRIPEILNSTFPDMSWNVPLTVEVEIGDSWGSMKPVDIR